MKPRNGQGRSLDVSSSRWMAYAVAGLATASGGAISAEGDRLTLVGDTFAGNAAEVMARTYMRGNLNILIKEWGL